MLRPGYIITGGGRTGSHWLEQIVKFITDYKSTDIHNLDGQGWVAHTNEPKDLQMLDQRHRETCGLLIIDRSDKAARAISYLVARRIDEWFFYSDKYIEPFDIEPRVFHMVQHGHQEWQQQIDTQVRPIYSHVIDFEYEELIAHSDRVEDYVAARLGIPNLGGQKDWSQNRNPRDYRSLVRNYRDLIG